MGIIPDISLGNIIAIITICGTVFGAVRWILKPILDKILAGNNEIPRIKKKLDELEISKKYWDMQLSAKLITVAHDFSTPEIDSYLDRFNSLDIDEKKTLIRLLRTQTLLEVDKSARQFVIDWLVLILETSLE